MTTTASDLERLRELARRFRAGEISPEELGPKVRDLFAISEIIRKGLARTGEPFPDVVELIRADREGRLED